MKKYFEMLAAEMDNSAISPEEIRKFRELVVDAMVIMGANPEEIVILHDASIRNAIRQKSTPEDLAWAILQ